jgi:hypothetical protein
MRKIAACGTHRSEARIAAAQHLWRHLMRFLLAAVLASISLFAAAGSASACSCAYQTAEEQLQSSDRVFSGTVLAVETVDGAYGEIRRAVVQVREIWKGDNEGRVTVETTPIGSCTFTLELGLTYLIYADQGEDAGVFWTHECKRTRLREYADDDIVKLGDPVFIVSSEAHSFGAVKARFVDGNS